MFSPQFGHSWWGLLPKAWCDRRISRRDLDTFFFGTAMALVFLSDGLRQSGDPIRGDYITKKPCRRKAKAHPRRG